MPRTSSSRKIMYSSPSSLISLPEYLPKRIRSPTCTSSVTSLPSSRSLPLPMATTSPSCGIGDIQTALHGGLLVLDALDDHAVIQRTNSHVSEHLEPFFPLLTPIPLREQELG